MLQYYEIPSIDVTVRKAVMDGIIQRVLNESGCDPRDVIFTDPQYENAHQIGATLGDQSIVSHAGSSKTYVEVQEERDEYSRINTVPGYDRQTPFFHNKADDVSVQPSLVRYNVTITLKRNSPSGDELHRWYNRLNSLLDMGRFSMMTEAEGYYFIPKECITLLAGCYHAANKRKPTFPDFKAYLKDGFNECVFVTDSQAGNSKHLAVRFSPTRVQVVYDTIEPYPNKEETFWEAMMVVRFTYQCPEEVIAAYPHIINQTPMEPQYFPQTDPAWLSNEEGVSRSLIQTLEDATIYNNFARILIRLPYSQCPIEQTHAIHYPDKNKELMIFASDITFAEDNMTDSFVLSTDSLDYEWNPYLKEYIDYCRKTDPSGQSCLFKFRLFEHGCLIPSKRLYWKGNELFLKGDVILEKKYFITESVRSDWRGVDLHPLRLFPKALLWLIAWLHPTISVPDEWWELEKFPPSIWEKVVDKTQPKYPEHQGPGVTPHPGTMPMTGPVTVLNTTILVARHEGQYVGRANSGGYIVAAPDTPIWVNMENRKLAELLRMTVLNGFFKEGF